MSRPTSDEAARAANVALVRSSALVLLAVGVAIVIVCGVAQGWDGAFGALLGVLFVGLFFGVDLAVFVQRRWSAPTSTTVVILLYIAKLLVFASLVVGLVAALSFDHGAFVVAVVVEALAAGAVAVRAFTRMRVPYVQP